jgi:hypothetical protein
MFNVKEIRDWETEDGRNVSSERCKGTEWLITHSVGITWNNRYVCLYNDKGNINKDDQAICKEYLKPETRSSSSSLGIVSK